MNEKAIKYAEGEIEFSSEEMKRIEAKKADHSYNDWLSWYLADLIKAETTRNLWADVVAILKNPLIPDEEMANQVAAYRQNLIRKLLISYTVTTNPIQAEIRRIKDETIKNLVPANSPFSCFMKLYLGVKAEDLN